MFKDFIKKIILKVAAFVFENDPAMQRMQQMEQRINDADIRIHDVQDRIYDTLWQIKTQNHQREMMFWQIYKRPDEALEEAQLRFFRSLPRAEGVSRRSQLVQVPLIQIIHEACEKNGIPYWLNFGTLLGAFRHGGFIPWDDDTDLGMMRADTVRLKEVLEKDPRVYVRDIMYSHPKNVNGLHRVFQVRYADCEYGTLLHYVDIFYYDYAEVGGAEAWKLISAQRDYLKNNAQNWPRTDGRAEKNPPEIDKALGEVLAPCYARVEKELGITENPGPYVVWGFDNGESPYGMMIFPYEMIFPLETLEFENHRFCVPHLYREYLNSIYNDIFSLPSDMLSHRHHKIPEGDHLRRLNWYYEKYVDSDERLSQVQ